MKLYSFQKKAVDDLLKGFKKNRAQCLGWYTGAGKTNVFIEMCRELIKKDPRVKIGISAYLTLEIKEQISDRLKEFGLGDKTHTINRREPRVFHKNITVFNPQGLYYNPSDEVIFDYFIVDESHVGMASDCVMLRKIMNKMCDENTKILLVSATPWDTLALKEFKEAPVFKRPLDFGLTDGLITDFKFHAEEAQIEFREEDFTRKGDLGKSAGQRHMALLKSVCAGKVEHIIKTYDKELGQKVIVICPPGNYTEIARGLAQRFGGLPFVQLQKIAEDASERAEESTQGNLEKFKTDPSVRFLFVVHKCQVGFDMVELDSVIDLTMTRNILSLAQRCGRIARKNGTREKHYFYIYDKSLMKDRLEWLVSTMIDFCLGAYDGWTTKTAKYRKTEISGGARQWIHRTPISVTLKEVISALKESGAIENKRTLAYVHKSGPPTLWSLERALSEATKYSSRTEMWSNRPALYKWFRLNAKDEMDRIFPLKHHIGKWNEVTVSKALKSMRGKTRNEFKKAFQGAHAWVALNKRTDLFDKFLVPPIQAWTHKRAVEAIAKFKVWSRDLRERGGLRHWMYQRGTEVKYKQIWMNMTPATAKKLQGKAS